MTSKYFSAVLVLNCLGFVNYSGATVAVYQPGNGLGEISVQGFNGPMALPVVQEFSTNGQEIIGGTASNSNLYALFDGASSLSNSMIAITDAQTGVFEETIPLNVRLNDIAYTNGQLYGLEVDSSGIQIVSIVSTGAVTPLVTQTATTAGVNWRLSGAVNGSSLFAMAVPAIGSPTAAYTIDPNTSQVSPFTFSPAPPTDITSESVIDLAGDAITLNNLSAQYRYAYPSGANGYQIPSLSQYPFGVVSDEFTYNYSTDKPAYVNLNLSGSLPVGFDFLTRSLPNFTVQTTLLNGAAPDGTTLSNVGVAPGTQLFTQASGPSALQISEIPLPAGFFSDRAISNDTISLSPGAQRGIYSYQITPNAFTADYTYGSTTDHGRPVDESSGQATFAYDPVSSNLVGNGDFSLGTAGWEADGNASLLPTLYSNAAVFLDNGGISLSPSSSERYGVRQLLQIPTPNVPMTLSLDYQNEFLEPEPSGTIEVAAYLNGTLIGEFVANSTASQTFETEIDDPSLQNLSDAYLTFIASDSEGSGFVNLDNISLTAVPEPASFGLLVAGLALTQRRSRRCYYLC